MTTETFFEKFELFADTPNAVAKMRELVLSLAVQGKLVVQDPTDEPAVELIKRISPTNTVNSVRKRAQMACPVSGVDMPFDLPDGWTWECLGNIGETNIGGAFLNQ